MPSEQQIFECCASLSKFSKEILLKVPLYPVWTECKARLIALYLFLFIQITKHGRYIDGFAGPQQDDKPDMWAAKLALEIRPQWLKRFCLFENNAEKVRMLWELRKQKLNENREIEIYAGDFNKRIHEFLKDNPVGEKEATFCLLDQRTFECKWSTVETLAKHKKAGYKIELFYFLAIGWLDRSISGLKNDSVLREWWGRDDSQIVLHKKPYDRALLFQRRFEEELGYKYVQPWPIYERRGGGRIMYFMIHCSDHPEAPKLMDRAYCNIIGRMGTPHRQLDMFHAQDYGTLSAGS